MTVPAITVPRFGSVDDAVRAIARGDMVVVIDDESRENEGDLVMAASLVTPDAVNFMKSHGRGLICVPMPESRVDRLGLQVLVPEHDLNATAFTTTVDLDLAGRSGLTAREAAACIQRLAAEDAVPSDFRTPGHVFPLRGRAGGVLERPGHTEAALDLVRLAALPPAAVICEIMSADGTMARLPELTRFVSKHNFLLHRIRDLITYRRHHRQLVRQVASCRLPTRFGEFDLHVFETARPENKIVALVRGESITKAPLVRIHSECGTGDLFGSLRCDCEQQLHSSLARIDEEGSGALLYLLGQEGRGIGLTAKIRAYALQENGHNTITANLQLGLPIDSREYASAAAVLKELGFTSIRLITNNPDKISWLAEFGIEVTDRIHSSPKVNKFNERYLNDKRDMMGHFDYAAQAAGSAGGTVHKRVR